jgi:hypothetical protein
MEGKADAILLRLPASFLPSLRLSLPFDEIFLDKRCTLGLEREKQVRQKFSN